MGSRNSWLNEAVEVRVKNDNESGLVSIVESSGTGSVYIIQSVCQVKLTIAEPRGIDKFTESSSADQAVESRELGQKKELEEMHRSIKLGGFCHSVPLVITTQFMDDFWNNRRSSASRFLCFAYYFVSFLHANKKNAKYTSWCCKFALFRL